MTTETTTRTYFTREIENAKGKIYIWHRFFNSVESFANNSMVWDNGTNLTDEECEKETSASYEDAMRSIRKDYDNESDNY